MSTRSITPKKDPQKKPNGVHPTATEATVARDIPISWIRLSKTNPRKHFNASADAELAQNIREHGVLQPVLIRPTHDEKIAYELVAGQRRFQASISAEKDSIPGVIRTLSDQQALEIQIIENVQREDISPIEEGEGFRRLIAEMAKAEPKSTDKGPRPKRQDLVEAVAERVKKSVRHIYSRMKLTEAHPDVVKALSEGKITTSHVDVIVGEPLDGQLRILDMCFAPCDVAIEEPAGALIKQTMAMDEVTLSIRDFKHAIELRKHREAEFAAAKEAKKAEKKSKTAKAATRGGSSSPKVSAAAQAKNAGRLCVMLAVGAKAKPGAVLLRELVKNYTENGHWADQVTEDVARAIAGAFGWKLNEGELTLDELAGLIDRNSAKLNEAKLAKLAAMILIGLEIDIPCVWNNDKLIFAKAKRFGVDAKKVFAKGCADYLKQIAEDRKAASDKLGATSKGKGVLRALSTFFGAEKVIRAARKKGLTNDELKEVIGGILGAGGGSLEDCQPYDWQDHKGGANPKISLLGPSGTDRFELNGVELLNFVRELLAIPLPLKAAKKGGRK